MFCRQFFLVLFKEERLIFVSGLDAVVKWLSFWGVVRLFDGGRLCSYRLVGDFASLE